MKIEVKNYEDVDVVSREEWGAVTPRHARKMKIPIPNVIFTYTTNTERYQWPACKTHEECCRTLQEMQKYYIEEKRIRDLPYNFIVGGDGRVYEGRGWYTLPAKNKRLPEIFGRSFEIAYMGDHHAKRPHKEMWRAAWDFIVISIHNHLVQEDYEFIENYDQKRLDEIQAAKPWYEQWYHFSP